MKKEIVLSEKRMVAMLIVSFILGVLSVLIGILIGTNTTVFAQGPDQTANLPIVIGAGPEETLTVFVTVEMPTKTPRPTPSIPPTEWNGSPSPTPVEVCLPDPCTPVP